ncbi:MAG: TolC family protein [Deltaproteobacteria bacterium]|nr:TolC family protein [Deltaproteobacteria bacterium]
MFKVLSKRLFLVAVVCGLLGAAGVRLAGAQALTLEETVAAGLAANPNVEATRQVLEEARLRVKAARGGFLPTLTVQSNYQRYTQSGDVTSIDYLDRDIWTSSLRLSQPLFAGYAILTAYQKAKLQVDMEQERLAQARLELIINIRRDFFLLLKLREDLRTVDNEIERIDNQLQASTVFFKSGLVPNNDVLKNEVELARSRTDRVKIENQIKNQITQLNTYRAAPLNESVDYVGDLRAYAFAVSYDETKAISTALLQRPDLRLGQKSIEIAQKEAKERFASYYPQVNLDFSHQHEKTEYDDYIYSQATQDSETLGISLQWNLFDGGTTTYNYKAAKKHITVLEKSLENQINEAQAAIVKAFTDIDDAEKLIKLTLRSRDSAQENYNMTAARYRTRIGTINDLFDAQYYLTRAEADISNAYMQYQTSKATLYYQIGSEE